MIRSNHLRSISERCLADFAFHSGHAALAASIALLVSAVSHLGTVPISYKVAGLLTEIFSPESELIHSPLI